MGHYNVISLIWVILLFFYIKYVVKLEEDKRNLFIKIQVLLVLLYNIGQFIVFPWKYPIELSTTSYFVVPIIVLFNIRKLNIWAVWVSIFIGVAYFGGMILAGNYMYSHFPVYSVLTSIFNHGSLLSYGIIMLYMEEFKKEQRYIIWIGIILSAGWAYMLRPFVTHNIRIFIYDVLDATFVQAFLNSSVIGYIVYYILLVIGLYYSANYVHALSKRLYQQRV